MRAHRCFLKKKKQKKRIHYLHYFGRLLIDFILHLICRIFRCILFEAAAVYGL